MPRPLRIILPHTPLHIMQRGHNRQQVFFSDEDYSYYRESLIYCKKEFGCRVYAYCLMTNHVHLIVDPGNDPESISRFMKRVAGRQTRYVNKRKSRSGSLWDGRFKSSPISTVEYLASCCRYIDLNPLRAGMVSDPVDYKWSSYRSKVQGIQDAVVDFDSTYLALDGDEQERRKTYAQYVYETIPESEIVLIREALQRGQLTGGERFRREVFKKHGVWVSNKRPGRPRKEIK